MVKGNLIKKEKTNNWRNGILVYKGAEMESAPLYNLFFPSLYITSFNCTEQIGTNVWNINL